MEPRRVNVINILQLLASTDEQEAYDKNVPSVDIATELVCEWFDSSFLVEEEWMKDFFTKAEWEILLEFHNYYDDRVNKLPDNYNELRNSYLWKEIVDKANWALDMLHWRNLEPKYS